MGFLDQILRLGLTFVIVSLMALFCPATSFASCERHVSGDPAWKLIRDLLPERYRDEGWDATVEQITDIEELKKLLVEKLHEEAKEFSKNPSAEEMADLLEVLKALQIIHNLDPNDIQKVQTKKAAEKGGFEKGYVLKIDSLRKRSTEN